MNDYIENELRKSSETISKIDPTEIRKAADIIIESLRNGATAPAADPRKAPI